LLYNIRFQIFKYSKIIEGDYLMLKQVEPTSSSHRSQDHTQASLHAQIPVLPSSASAPEPDWSLATWQQLQPQEAEEQLTGLAAAKAGQGPPLAGTHNAGGYGQTMWGLHQSLGQTPQQEQQPQQQIEQLPQDQGPLSIDSKDQQQGQDQTQQQPHFWQHQQQMQQYILTAEDPRISRQMSRQPSNQQHLGPYLGAQQQGLTTQQLGQQETETPSLAQGSGSSGGRASAAARSKPDSSKRKPVKPRIVPPAPPAAPPAAVKGIEGAWLTVTCGALTGVLDLSDMLVRVQLETVRSGLLCFCLPCFSHAC
jgi:hypothetical protein